MVTWSYQLVVGVLGVRIELNGDKDQTAHLKSESHHKSKAWTHVSLISLDVPDIKSPPLCFQPPHIAQPCYTGYVRLTINIGLA